MKASKRELQGFREAIKAYRKHLKGDTYISPYHGLCCFVYAAPYTGEDSLITLNVIYPRLGGKFYLQDWLVHQGHATHQEINSPEGHRKLVATRLAWAKSLLKEFS